MEEKLERGRPTVITEEVIRKMEEVFAWGGTDLEACLYADISKTALYEFQKDNPEFAERKEKLKERPFLKARQTIVKGLDDPTNAKWYLERKGKGEFAQRTEVTGAEGAELGVVILPPKKNEDSLGTST